MFLRTLREDPVDAEVMSHKLLVRAGYIRRAAPGVYSWLPLGLAVLTKIERIVREEMNAIGAQEVHFPALLPREPYEASGRWTEYGENLFRLKDRKDADYLLAPTHEEMFTLLVKDLYSSYKDLPVSLYQIQTKYRDEARPRAGLLRGREFIMKDSYSFDVSDEGLDASYEAHRQAYLRIFERLGLEVVPVFATAGAMGGSKSEEFLHPSEAGEDTFVRSAGGYAANVEAVATTVPEPIDFTDAPPCRVVDTPDTPTISSLVEFANAEFPQASRDWTAADTLKNVVLAVTSAEGERQIVVVGMPGNREADLKRIEANIGALLGFAGEPDVEAATDADFAKHPGLVRGYIGPGTSLDSPVLGEKSTTALPYFLDPRVVDGTTWITGANEARKHVIGLVAGRDFAADGYLECATVLAGDPAPDGSGPLEIARGMEMGHIFQLGRKYAEALGLKVLDENGKLVTVTMGSYGIGVSRALAAIAEQGHDEHGLIWPASLAPAQVHVVAAGKQAEILDGAAELAESLEQAGLEVLLDDRPKVSPGVKFGDTELLGMPVIVVVGRAFKDGRVEVKDRRSGERTEVELANVEQAVRQLLVG
ncbi:proline--tRNA ligase [Falsarthrobacter nasiphocae]|uniref:Proline--tRNA ligase n=1 Tax=Falsarthrobacter nasiphocae TaxID=189863 RepID=A0AAE4C8Q2_9MICC|nr:prolyl-tRNA synthetase [Falsarthrobacter nasiphocae]